MAIRDYDKAIRALRREALNLQKTADAVIDGTVWFLAAAAHSCSASYLASITGKEERAAKKAKAKRGK